jgi:hypothetical protein
LFQVAYERNAKRLLTELDSRDTTAAMRAYADEIDARAAELEAPDAQRAAFSSRCSYSGGMSAMREELHLLVDELPEAELRPVLELIRGRADAAHGVRNLPFFASFESDPDLSSTRLLDKSRGGTTSCSRPN